jgi:putative cardiolipin synthase
MTSRIARSLALAAYLLATGCSSLPPATDRVPSTAFQDTEGTLLGRAIAPHRAEHPGRSGIHPLERPLEAFVARGVLASAAERSLDVQYYIWHHDTTGTLLFEALWDAAQRGVRVRLLLDDNNTSGLDPTIAALDAHPNIEVRLFNPFPHRDLRALDYLSDFGRTNRRMHNKSFTADNQATIVGGRNVGDEYYGAEGPVVFADLDVLAIGPVVREVSAVFDLYWNSESAYPAILLTGPAPAGAEETLRASFAAMRATPGAARYLEALRATPLAEQFRRGTVSVEWTTARVVHDDPSKVLGKADRSELLMSRLARMVGKPGHSFDVISPYFVPGAEGTATLTDLVAQGVKVRVLTNSLAATDVSAVHAGYAKRRADLLRGGVALYELKPTAQAEAAQGVRSTFGGSSAASLHAKTFAIDGQRLFVGSFNMDPRSAALNTEMGVVVDSPALAAGVTHAFEKVIPGAAYEVRLDADGRLVWIERTAAGERRYDTDPETGAGRRIGVGLMSVLPIEWLL